MGISFTPLTHDTEPYRRVTRRCYSTHICKNASWNTPPVAGPDGLCILILRKGSHLFEQMYVTTQ